MKPQRYEIESRGVTDTAVIRVGAKGGRKTVAVYSDPNDARDVAATLNRNRRGEL